jgi:cysteine desulfurase/selenocysteine lyase
LKSVVQSNSLYCGVPDAHSRPNIAAQQLHRLYEEGISATRCLLNAENGVVFSEQTASRVLFAVNGAIIRNVPGSNVITTALEHPGSFDSVSTFASRTGKELRIAPANPSTGGVDVEKVIDLMDGDTILICLIYASNISGAILDLEKIVREARKINPDVYIVVDATQHVPHGVIDIKKMGTIDGLVFAPYKVFGKRGIGIGYVSDRVSMFEHDRLIEKSATTWELGSADPLAFGTMKDVVDYIQWVGAHFISSTNQRECLVAGMEAIHAHEFALLERMISGSNEIPGIRFIQNANVNFIPKEGVDDRDCILALNFDNVDTETAVKAYADAGIIVFSRLQSNVMSRRALKALGSEGIIRVSPLHCHSFEEIDRFLKATMEIASF